MANLITITGPIAAGKNTVADALAERCVAAGRSVVIVDVDDVAAMVGAPGAGAAGLWSAAHEVHGVAVAQWMRSTVDVVISVGPVYTTAENDALFGRVPAEAQILRVLVDAPISVTWARVVAAKRRGLSGHRDFHESAHARYRALMPEIPADLIIDSTDVSAADIATAIETAAGLAG